MLIYIPNKNIYPSNCLALSQKKWSTNYLFYLGSPNKKQKELMTARIKKLEQSDKRKDYTKKLFQNYKSWESPCTTQKEHETVLLTKPDMQERS